MGWVLCSIGVVNATAVVTVITVVDSNNSRSKCSCNTNKDRPETILYEELWETCLTTVFSGEEEETVISGAG